MPIYCADSLVRRAPALQATADARAPQASLPAAIVASRRAGSTALAEPCITRTRSPAARPSCDHRAAGTVRVPTGHPDTATLGAQFGAITVEKA